MQIAIYGLYEGRVCLYVGQTINPEKRLKQHRSEKLKGRQFVMRILRWCESSEARRIEWQVILSYWRKGEADLNIHGRYNAERFWIIPRTQFYWNARISKGRGTVKL